MTTLGKLGLGWPFPSGLPQGPDWEFLRRAFGDLAKTLSWPFVHLTHTGPTALPQNPWNMTVDNRHDASALFRPATDRIYCPQDFNQYLAVGATGGEFVTTATGTTSLVWRKNTLVTVWATNEYSVAGTLRITVPLIEPMNKGEFLTLSSTGPAGTDANSIKASVFFIPLR